MGATFRQLALQARRTGMALFFALPVGLACGTGVAAQEAEPLVRAEINPGPTVVVGQTLRLTVAVFVPTFFRGAPRFEEIQIPNALTSPPGRTQNLTERQGTSSWAGQQVPYDITPQVPGVYEIPPVSVTFTMGGSEPREMTLTTQPRSFEAIIPAEARGLPYFIGTTLLTAQQELEPRSDTLRVGDALSRTISVSVREANSIVIPPLAPDSIPGLNLYIDPPRVSDTGGERGETRVGTRVERLTYIAQDPGDYTLPPLEVAWWDLERGRLERTVLPAIEFTVVPNPESEPVFGAEMDQDSAALALMERPESSLDWGNFLAVIGTGVALLMLGWLTRRLVPRVREWGARRVAERKESEGRRFAALVTACKDENPRAVREALARWMEALKGGGETGPLEEFAAAHDLPELAEEIRILDAHLFGRGAAVWSGADMARIARGARSSLERAGRTEGAEDRPFGLSKLNPL